MSTFMKAFIMGFGLTLIYGTIAIIVIQKSLADQPEPAVRYCYDWDGKERSIEDVVSVEWNFAHYGLPVLQECVGEPYEILSHESGLTGIDRFYSKHFRESHPK